MATTKNLLTDHLATRARSIDFAALGLLLPNPDPVLKAQGKDIEVYRAMLSDALIGGCVRRRKSAVKALDWGLDRGKASSRTAKAVQQMLDGLDMERMIGQMLDATLFGYQPMEVLWQARAGYLVPVDVQAKPPEWFCFDAENQLRFKSLAAPLFGEALPAYKFLLPRQDPTYQNPYGFADLSMCFWPLVFKKGSLKFWLAFTEKFGSAFMTGKLPRSATTEERATLLDSLEALIQDGVAVIPDDGSIEPVEVAGKAASADLYEKLVLHCRSEISIALLGQNQTTEANSNRASATAGLEVTADLRDGDAEIVAAAINQLIKWFCEKNFSDTQHPVWSLWDQSDQDTLQAARDKSNFDAGAKFSNAYWMRAYGYQEGDLQPEAVALTTGAAALGSDPNAATTASFADPTAPLNPLANEVDQLSATAAAPWAQIIAQVQSLVNRATSMAQLQDALLQLYGDLDTTELTRIMAAGLALAELKGMDAAASEAAGPAAFADPVSAPPAVIAGTDPQSMQTPQSIHIHLPSNMVNIAAPPAPPPANVQVDVHVPDQPPPIVNVAAAQIDVQPAPVTVNNTYPARAVQEVELDAAGEIARTVTRYEASV